MTDARKSRTRKTAQDDAARREEAPSKGAPDSDETAEAAPGKDNAAPEPAAETTAEAATEPQPSPEEQLAAERDDLREKWLRTLADLDNLRKRSRREIQDARRFAQVEVLRPLLDIADNFDRAIDSFGTEADVSTDAVREGVALIHQSFRGLLRERGVEPIEALGRQFDPNEHEAVAQMASDDHPSGVVVEVVQPGYRFGDMVLRPARVVIAS